MHQCDLRPGHRALARIDDRTDHNRFPALLRQGRNYQTDKDTNNN
jgi:hypothetical protein